MAEPRYTLFGFEDLDGWAEDDHAAALETFQETCADLRDAEWAKLCAVATQNPNPRMFFETFFQPVLVQDGSDMLFTGYFEPELTGSVTKSDTFAWPLYRLPQEAADGAWLTRRELEETGALDGRGLEIAWINDPVDVFFLQIQGSGRVSLTNGQKIRVGFGGSNGQPYSSIGQELVRRGIYEPHQVSADVIRAWVKRNPEDGAELLRVNDSYVFFREVSEVPADKGPLGAMNRSVTTMRSVAVDPAFHPLGAPIWIEKSGSTPLNRLMIAQDTGSAIKGAQRADIFFGTGREAGRAAGRVRDTGRMITLLPRQTAFALFPEELQ
ncbi:MAG: MltA domain-containing protein [Pseudomonadota bacterium]